MSDTYHLAYRVLHNYQRIVVHFGRESVDWRYRTNLVPTKSREESSGGFDRSDVRANRLSEFDPELFGDRRFFQGDAIVRILTSDQLGSDCARIDLGSLDHIDRYSLFLDHRCDLREIGIGQKETRKRNRSQESTTT